MLSSFQSEQIFHFFPEFCVALEEKINQLPRDCSWDTSILCSSYAMLC